MLFGYKKYFYIGKINNLINLSLYNSISFVKLRHKYSKKNLYLFRNSYMRKNYFRSLILFINYLYCNYFNSINNDYFYYVYFIMFGVTFYSSGINTWNINKR